MWYFCDNHKYMKIHRCLKMFGTCLTYKRKVHTLSEIVKWKLWSVVLFVHVTVADINIWTQKSWRPYNNVLFFIEVPTFCDPRKCLFDNKIFKDLFLIKWSHAEEKNILLKCFSLLNTYCLFLDTWPIDDFMKFSH